MPRPEYYGFEREDLIEMIGSSGIAPRRVLDVGCARGLFGERLAQVFDADVTGVEIDEAVAADARSRLRSVVVGDFASVAKGLGRFDTVVFADSLEHMRDPWGALRTAHGLLERSGHLVLSVPNVSHWSVVWGLMGGRWDYQDEGLLDRTHIRFFTPRSLLETLDGSGFEVVHRDDHVKRPRIRHAPLWGPVVAVAPHLLVFQVRLVARKRP